MSYFSESTDSLVKKASYLRIAAADLAEGMKSGNFRSLYRGQGIEFSGVRDYIRGDDIRSIDWNVTARMGHPYVKVFEEERELQIFVVVDTSASMHLHTWSRDGGLKDLRRTKYSVAAETAALITIAAEMNSCPLGAALFDGQIHFSCKPQLGREQTMLILTHLDKKPEVLTQGSVLGNALTGSGQLLRKRSLIFVISDFRSADYEKPLISLAQKNDVVAIRMEDAFDIELPSVGTIPFIDAETGIKMRLPTNSEKFKKEWKDFYNQNESHWQNLCIKHGVMSVIMKTGDSPLLVLTSIFGRKAK